MHQAVAAHHLLLFLQERQSDSCESISEATSQSSSSCDRLATLEAMGTDTSPPGSPDSHLHTWHQEYKSAAAEMSLKRDCSEEGASMSDASSSTIVPAQGAAAPCAQSTGSEVCTMMSHASLQLPNPRSSSDQAFNNALISSFLHHLPPLFIHSFFLLSFLPSFMHSFIHPSIHPFIPSFCLSSFFLSFFFLSFFPFSFLLPFLPWSVHSFLHSLTHSLTHSLVHAISHSFIKHQIKHVTKQPTMHFFIRVTVHSPFCSLDLPPPTLLIRPVHLVPPIQPMHV